MAHDTPTGGLPKRGRFEHVPVGRMKLHEAMVEILVANGGRWMDRDDIAREIAQRGLFRRPSDGAHPPSDQLRLRARKPEYQHLFECSDTRCTRIRLRPGVGTTQAARQPSVTRARRAAKSSRAPKDHELRQCASSELWYERLRHRYKPDRLRYLLIGESPPDPGAGQRRFFYSPILTHDNLYRGVTEAVYGLEPDFDVRAKPVLLERLADDGFWLIDAVSHPVNQLGANARTRAIADGVANLIRTCTEVEPECGVIICHGKVYDAAAHPLREAGVALLHDEALPFPLGNWRARFVDGFRRALS
jgi:hypothetical protein